jgi:hypothetical protein
MKSNDVTINLSPKYTDVTLEVTTLRDKVMQMESNLHYDDLNTLARDLTFQRIQLRMILLEKTWNQVNLTGRTERNLSGG